MIHLIRTFLARHGAAARRAALRERLHDSLAVDDRRRIAEAAEEEFARLEHQVPLPSLTAVPTPATTGEARA